MFSHQHMRINQLVPSMRICAAKTRKCQIYLLWTSPAYKTASDMTFPWGSLASTKRALGAVKMTKNDCSGHLYNCSGTAVHVNFLQAFLIFKIHL